MESSTLQRWSGRGVMALGLTMLVPGLGQWAAGRRRRALIWFVMTSFLLAVMLSAAIWPAVVPLVLVIIPLLLIVAIVGWIDAFQVGSRSVRPMLGQPQTRYLLGMLGMVFGMPLLPLLPALACAHQWLCEAFFIPTVSMAPTLLVGDRFIAHKLQVIHRWDVVVFRSPLGGNDAWVKRVVGMPGEVIVIKENRLTINGRRIALPGEMGPLAPTTGGQVNATGDRPIKLGADEYFVIGDNTRASNDSRYWSTGIGQHQTGALPFDHIIGKGTYIYWPIHRWKKLY